MQEQNAAVAISLRHYLGIFLLSLATLLLELSLTRVLSVALWYHFGFLVISTALLGFGTSGVVLALWRRLREKICLDRALATLALLFGLLTVLCFWLMQRIPFDPFSLFSDQRQLAFMPLYYIVISLPFFCSGLALALLFTRGGKRVNRLYAFDLVGAGIGCGALALIMPAFGGSGSVVVSAALGLLAAAIFGFRVTKSIAGLAIILAVGFFAVAFFANNLLPISITPNKSRPQNSPIYTAWNTFSKIDVYETKAVITPAGPRTTMGRGARRFIFDAGTAATGMSDLRPNVHDALKQLEGHHDFSSNIAYVGKTRPSVLIIGSGGGGQVLDALHYGAAKIVAVEINPIINDVITNRMRDYWGDLYQQPEVQVVTEEGRSFVRRSHEQYDAIISVHTISNAAIASGALSLAENYVLTREAFEDYLDHLKSDGVLYFTRPETQIARLFSTGREALAARGIADLPSHFFAYRTLPAGEHPAGFKSFGAGFLMKKTPFTAEDIAAIRKILKIGEPAQPSEGTTEILYTPGEPASDSIYHRLLTAPDLRAVYASEPAQIEPATDDRPFFNQHTRWSTINWKTFQDIFTQDRKARMALEDRPIAEVTLIVLLVQSILVAAVLILLPLVKFSRQDLRVPHRGNFLIYFAGLGLGFIMIEIALLQRFTLFLGQPVYTFAVVLAALLIFTGIGAALSDKFGASARTSLRFIVPLILLTLLVTAFATPYIFNAALGWSLLSRVVISVLILAPLGLLLGMPFPSGLRIIGEEAPALVPWAWGVNGFFTVIGTVGALILGMAFGFKAVLVIASLCYLTALAAVVVARRPDNVPAG